MSESVFVFPHEGEIFEHPDKDGLVWTGSYGLTKRELFAAMAMQGMIAYGINEFEPKLKEVLGETLAIQAVEAADFLIAELAKEKT